MKSMRNIKSILIMAIIAAITIVSISVKSLASTTAKVIVETANLRQSAASSGKILEQISINETVEVIEQSGDWYKVKYKSIEGYLRNDLISVNGEVSAPTPTENSAPVENNVQQTQQVATETQTEQTSANSEQTGTEETPEAEPTKHENLTNKLGEYLVKEDVSVKVIPLIQAREIATVKSNAHVKVVEIKNDWACIEVDNTKGWVVYSKLDQVKDATSNLNEVATENNTTNNEKENTQAEQQKPAQTTKTQYVRSESVNLREQPNTSSNVLTSVTLNTEVTVVEETNGWSKVQVNGKQGYISTSLLSDKKQETSRASETVRKEADTQEQASTETQTSATTQNTPAPEATSTSGTGSEVVAYANQFMGYKYVYGGTSTSGFDCSGFTQYVYKHFGVSIGRTAAAQYNSGKSVTELKAGDLVMFGPSGISHVGIYIGGGRFIHAANASRGITTDTLLSGYYKTHYVGARRIF